MTGVTVLVSEPSCAALTSEPASSFGASGATGATVSMMKDWTLGNEAPLMAPTMAETV